MRSLLFVPGDSERKLEKALASGADALILDLEDAVAIERKPAARQAVHAFLTECRGKAAPLLYVRVNSLAGGMVEDDLAAIMPARPAGIVLPKPGGADDLLLLSARLRVHEAENVIEDRATRILPLIETAGAVLAAPSLGRPLPRLSGITWGAEDLSAEVGARAARDAEGRYTGVFQLARSLTLLAASAASVAAIDTVHPDFRDEAGLARRCAEAARDGFSAMLAIHPAQVPVINAAFTPSAEDMEEARGVVAAFAQAGGAGVVAIGGKMYDRPHLTLAERLLSRAKAAGIG